MILYNETPHWQARHNKYSVAFMDWVDTRKDAQINPEADKKDKVELVFILLSKQE